MFADLLLNESSVLDERRIEALGGRRSPITTESGMLTAAFKAHRATNFDDGWLLYFTRFARLFAYGSLSVVLVLYLNSLGLSDSQTGVLLTLTLGR
ncbi:MAG: hypothetical protein ACR2IV_18725 [Bryobacteraceae bacterium]